MEPQRWQRQRLCVRPRAVGEGAVGAGWGAGLGALLLAVPETRVAWRASSC